MMNYDFIGRFCEGVAVVKVGDKYGVINNRFEELCPIQYDYIECYKSGYARAYLNEKVCLLNRLGNEVCFPKYDAIIFDPLHDDFFVNGYAIVKLDGKYGYIDKRGNEICAIRFDAVDNFDELFSEVKLKGCWYYMNRRGELSLR